MNDREAFERAIRLNPQDEAPRLIYADWLEEQGYDEWAYWMRMTANGVTLKSVVPPGGAIECTWDGWKKWGSLLVPDAMHYVMTGAFWEFECKWEANTETGEFNYTISQHPGELHEIFRSLTLSNLEAEKSVTFSSDPEPTIVRANFDTLQVIEVVREIIRDRPLYRLYVEKSKMSIFEHFTQAAIHFAMENPTPCPLLVEPVPVAAR